MQHLARLAEVDVPIVDDWDLRRGVVLCLQAAANYLHAAWVRREPCPRSARVFQKIPSVGAVSRRQQYVNCLQKTTLRNPRLGYRQPSRDIAGSCGAERKNS